MTVAPARLTLRQFVSANLADAVTDFHAEAERLVSAIPDTDRDDYLAQALISIIGEITGQRRRNAFDAARNDETPETRIDHRCDEPHGTAVSTSRVSRLRDTWTDLLNAVGLSADGGRKRVGDMTAADLLANVEHREQLARENYARADQFRELHKMLVEQGVETVDQIEVDQ